MASVDRAVLRERRCDVVVLGAGPAGLAAAIHAARSGLEVVCISFARRHGRPGETLHPGVEPLFDRLGVGDDVRGAGFLRHEGHRIVWGDRDDIQRFGADASRPWRGFQADGTVLDAILAAGARRSSVNFVAGAARVLEVLSDRGVWVVSAGDDVVRARWLIDATGKRRVVPSRLRLAVDRVGPRRTVAWGYARGRVEDVEDLPVLRGTTDGWCWLARIGDDRLAWSTVRLGGGPAALTEMIPACARALEAEAPPRGDDATASFVPHAAGPGYFVVGDAAVRLDPLSSHGVLRGLMSGMMAAHLARVASDQPNRAAAAVEHYREWLGAWFSDDQARVERFYVELHGAC